MKEPNEFDLESQEWVTLKSNDELEKEILLFKEKFENEKKEKAALKNDVNTYLKETIETLKQVDLSILNTEKIKAENEKQEKLLQKKINKNAKLYKKQKKIRKKLAHEILKNKALKREIASLESTIFSKNIEQNKTNDALHSTTVLANHFERILAKRDEEIKEKKHKICTLTDTLSQKEEEITKLRQMLNEKKSYAAVTKGNIGVFTPTQLKNR